MAHCSICLDIAKIPVCCIPCGHVFCNICIQRWRVHGGPVPVQLAGFTTAECPQCRSNIETIQPIRFDASESPADEDLFHDPWDESDVGNIIKSLHNIWWRSQLRHQLVGIQERVLSHDRVKSGWYKLKDGCRKTRTLAHEFMAVDGGFENKVNWLKSKGSDGLVYMKSQLISHPYTEYVKTKWNNLSEDWKFVCMMAMVVSVLLLILDVQNKNGFMQSVILPVFTTFFYILKEIFACVGYTLFRPLFCSLLCTMEVASTIADVTVQMILTMVNIVVSIITLPVTMAIGLFQVTTIAINTVLRTVLPVFLLAYFLSPKVQYFCRNLLTRLQQNR